MPVCLALAVCACAARAHEQRYTGALDGCGISTATLNRQGDEAAFTPGDGVLVLRGTVGADGSLIATLNTQPAGKPPYMLKVQARFAGESAAVTYTTPKCTAQGSLALVHPGLF